MSVRILQGDCRDLLKTLPDRSVHCCVTSPPYFGLRDYGTGTWVGGNDGCDHRGGPMRLKASINANAGTGRDVKNAEDREFFKDVCGKCGARRIDQQLGLEQMPDDYVRQMVSVFEQVRRVLRDDGTLWLNLGDCYAGSGKGRNADGTHSVGGKQDTNAGANIGKLNKTTAPCCKPKDLIGIPWRVAFALQEAGWYLRSDIIWHKLNPMPESVTDRPTKAHEYIFLLSKSPTYFYDAQAIREEQTASSRVRSQYAWRGRTDDGSNGARGGSTFKRTAASGEKIGTIPADGKRNKRSVWTVGTRPFKGAHFATFPTTLIEPCILAGCPEGGTVLDPFGGAGTTGLVAERLNRNAILIELNPRYAALAEERIRTDAPMLAQQD
jgi:DNA modification methylase